MDSAEWYEVLFGIKIFCENLPFVPCNLEYHFSWNKHVRGRNELNKSWHQAGIICCQAVQLQLFLHGSGNSVLYWTIITKSWDEQKATNREIILVTCGTRKNWARFGIFSIESVLVAHWRKVNKRLFIQKMLIFY